MKHGRWPIVMVFLVMTVAGCSPTMGPDSIDWSRSIPLGIEKAAVDQHLFVYFGASWCTVCARMDRETLRTLGVWDAMGDFVPVKVDVDAQPRVAEAYLAQSVPAFVIIDRRGNVQARAYGYQSEEELIAFLSMSTEP